MWFSYGKNLELKNESYGIGRMSTDGKVKLFPIEFGATGLTVGPDGALWFTSGPIVHLRHPEIGRITTSGTVTMFPLPPPANPAGVCKADLFCTNELAAAWAMDIVSGPDGNLWAVGQTESIWRITPAGSVTTFDTPTSSAWPGSIVAAGSNLWVRESDTVFNFFLTSPEALARVTTTGTIEEIGSGVLGTGKGRPLNGIAGMHDGSVWAGSGHFALHVTATGAVTKFPVPGNLGNVVAGPDGKPWFTTQAHQLMTISNSGHVSVIRDRRMAYDWIGAGPGNTLWISPLRGYVLRVTLR